MDESGQYYQMLPYTSLIGKEEMKHLNYKDIKISIAIF